MIHSCTVHGCQLLGYRQPGLLAQTAFCQPCKTEFVHYRANRPTGEPLSESVVCQTAANGRLDLSCGLCTFLSSAGNTALLSLLQWQGSSPPACHPPLPPHPTPLPPTHPLISTIRDITGPVKNYLKNQQ